MSTDSGGVARNSLSVAKWTLVSRVSGFARALLVAAVLGPTYLGNTFQATNTLPNLTFELLTGSLIASLLVPALVSHVDGARRDDVERVAGGFLGAALIGFGVVVVLGVLAGPLLLALLSSTVEDASTAQAQERVGLLLLALLMPQVLLYGVAGIGGAVMNAHGRFALAAGAPALENVGVMITMVVFVVLFGAGPAVETIGNTELIVLGAGTTASVGVHAAITWWGARRVGVRLVPRAGWKDAEVRRLLGRAVPSIGYSSLNALRVFAVIIASNSIAGGVVAFALALNFLHLPTALAGRPVAVALLPTLSRLSQAGDLARFRDEFVRGLGLVCFLTIPAVAIFLLLSEPLARAASFGELATPEGVALVAAGVAGIALGVLGEGAFVMATHAAYALEDTRTPFVAMIVRTVVSLAGVALALTLSDGTDVVLTLGLAISAGNLVGVLFLARRLIRRLPPGRQRLLGAIARAVGASGAMAVPAVLIARALGGDGDAGTAGAVLAMALATAAGGAVFLALQRALRSPELAFFVSGLGRRGVSDPA